MNRLQASIALALAVVGTSPMAQEVQPPNPEQAYQDAADSLLALTPEEIRAFMREVRERQRASQDDRNTELIGQSMRVGLSPGSRAPRVTMALGHTTAITIIDASGAPWPLRSSVIGDESAVTLTDPGGMNANILMLTPRQPFARTNLALVLDGVDTPLMVTLETDGSRANDHITLQLDRTGPNAAAPIVQAPTPRVDTDDGLMRNLMDGVIPIGAELVNVSGGDASAYRVGPRLYLRTQGVLRWPAPLAVVYGVDNVKVYELPAQALLVVSNRQGDIEQLRVSDTGMLLDATLSARAASVAPGSILLPADPARNPYTPRLTGAPVAGERPRIVATKEAEPTVAAPKAEAAQ